MEHSWKSFVEKNNLFLARLTISIVLKHLRNTLNKPQQPESTLTSVRRTSSMSCSQIWGYRWESFTLYLLSSYCSITRTASMNAVRCTEMHICTNITHSGMLSIHSDWRQQAKLRLSSGKGGKRQIPLVYTSGNRNYGLFKCATEKLDPGRAEKGGMFCLRCGESGNQISCWVLSFRSADLAEALSRLN